MSAGGRNQKGPLDVLLPLYVFKVVGILARLIEKHVKVGFARFNGFGFLQKFEGLA